MIHIFIGYEMAAFRLEITLTKYFCLFIDLLNSNFNSRIFKNLKNVKKWCESNTLQTL